MKKVVVLFLILSFVIPLSAIADSSPRVIIGDPQSGEKIKVHMFYDTTAMILCYVTSHGRAMQCWQFDELKIDTQQRIDLMLIEYQKANKSNVPSILIIPGK